MNKKRYSEIKTVSFTLSKFPVDIVHLLDDFKKWSYISDDAIELMVTGAPVSELEALVKRCDLHLDSIEKFATKHKDDIPVPQEAALVQIFLNSYYTAKAEYGYRHSKYQRKD